MKPTPNKPQQLDPLERDGGKKLFLTMQISPKMMDALGKLACRSGLTRSKYCRVCLHGAIQRGDIYRVKVQETLY